MFSLRPPLAEGPAIHYTATQACTHMKIVILLFLVVIVGSLGSALFYLVRDKGTSTRTIKSLTVRVGLSVTLFVLLMLGYYFGLIPQQGL